MNTQPPLAGESGSNTGRLAGATSSTELLGTQQERRHMLVHRNAANVATKHMTQDSHFKILRKTGAAKTRCGMELDVSITTSWQTAVN